MKPAPVYDYLSKANGFIIRRNEQIIKTPAEQPLNVPTANLAEAIADEWRRQGDTPKPETMPFTQLAMTAVDIIAKKRAGTVAALAAYAENDLLCHYAEDPPELTALQAKTWHPWLEWAAKYYKVKPLHVGEGVMPIAQPAETLAALHEAVDAHGVFHLAGLQQATGITGSLILGLAMAGGKATAAELYETAELETLFQSKKWGEDPVTAARLASARKELEQCEQWFALLVAK